jgi:bifunctional N-acetylglucosamine-1-phosphate-uridyltransferase/glucosamine-1-phosphate-acetyltransferase GlmU-like protein
LTNINAQNKYYLTDIIEIIKKNEDVDIELFTIEKENQSEIMGVNTSDQLATCTRKVSSDQKLIFVIACEITFISATQYQS